MVAIAWGYTIYIAQGNADMGASMGMAMGNVRSWNGADFSLMYLMWAVMMVAMMVPSAAPMVLLFATVNRRRREQSRPFVATSIFLSGYLVRFRAGGHARQLGSAPSFAAVVHDGWQFQRLPGRRAAAGGRFVPVEPVEVCLPYPLPQSDEFPDVRLERGDRWRVQDGSAARQVLPWLLLDTHGSAVRSGRDEPGVDRRALLVAWGAWAVLAAAF